MSLAGVLALIIFAVMFVFIVIDKIERQYVTLGCGLLTMAVVFGVVMRSWEAIKETLNIGEIFTLDFWYQAGEASESACGINWATIIFVAGMMIMVEGMAKAGFFRWLCMTLAKMVNYKSIPLFICSIYSSASLCE